MEFFESLDSRIYGTAGLVIVLLLLYFRAKGSNDDRKLLILATILVNFVYMIWRTGFTIPVQYGIGSLILGVLLLGSEWMGIIHSVIFRLLLWSNHRTIGQPEDGFSEEPTVDVLITTYNEDASTLRKTIVGCLNLDYPKDRMHIYLCEDGKREEAKNLCRELNIDYISRDDNPDGRAGIINHALKQISGEFILLLNADMVPKTEFLRKTIDYFADDGVGFVQTPQVFHNPDPFQYNLGFQRSIPEEQDFFRRDIQDGRARHNAVLHMGTNAVLRRSAIDAIGGIPSGTITEDLVTGMLIQAKGYRSIFVRETLCVGLSAEGFPDLLIQRERWARGNIQVMKKWNPMTLPGLSFVQRLIYMDGIFHWLFGIRKMIYLTMPILYLLFGLVVLDANVFDLLFYWLPSSAASMLAFRAFAPETRTILWSHIYDVAMAPYLAWTSVFELLLPKSARPRARLKRNQKEYNVVSFSIAMPHIFLYAMIILGWAISIPAFLFSGMQSSNAFAIYMGWSVYNFVAIMLGVMVCVERPRIRTAERLKPRDLIELLIDGRIPCKMVDLSESGLQVICGLIDGDTLPEVGSVVWISGETFERVQGELKWKENQGDKITLGIHFSERSNSAYQSILRHLTESGV